MIEHLHSRLLGSGESGSERRNRRNRRSRVRLLHVREREGSLAGEISQPLGVENQTLAHHGGLLAGRQLVIGEQHRLSQRSVQAPACQQIAGAAGLREIGTMQHSPVGKHNLGSCRSIGKRSAVGVKRDCRLRHRKRLPLRVVGGRCRCRVHRARRHLLATLLLSEPANKLVAVTRRLGQLAHCRTERRPYRRLRRIAERTTLGIKRHRVDVGGPLGNDGHAPAHDGLRSEGAAGRVRPTREGIPRAHRLGQRGHRAASRYLHGSRGACRQLASVGI